MNDMHGTYGGFGLGFDFLKVLSSYLVDTLPEKVTRKLHVIECTLEHGTK